MRPRGWQGIFPYCAVTASTTVCSVECHLLLNEGDRLCALWNETLLQSFNVFYVFQSVFYLLRINFYMFILFKLFVFLLWVFNKFLQPHRCFTLELDSDVHDDFISPI
jgi:hypothetical protein